MDYFGIIKKAYYLARRHKFLWIFGILAGGAGGLRSFNLSLPNFSSGNDNWSKLSNSTLTTANFATFWDAYGTLVLTIIGILLFFCILMFVLNIISQGALVSSSARLGRGEKTNFKSGFYDGLEHFWRIFGIGLTYLLMILASLIVLIVPVAVLISTETYIFAAIWGILLLLVCLLFWLMIAILFPYSLRVVVLENFGVFKSIRESLHFFRDHWQEVIVMYLLLWAIGLGFGIALAIVIAIVAVLLLALGLGLWLALPLAAIIYGSVIGLAFLVVIAVVCGAYNSFYWVALTLTYQKLKLAKEK